MSHRDVEDTKVHREQLRPTRLYNALRSLPSDHPVLIALRTYALSLSFSLGPALAGILLSSKPSKKDSLVNVLKRELGASGIWRVSFGRNR